MKRRIAHIINPFIASESSDLHTAQPITFASMLHAKEKAADVVDVELWSAHYPEDRSIVHPAFSRTKELDRSVLDLGDFEKKMKLPLIHDIMQRLYDSSDAEYFIYTNVDIGVYPDFYLQVNEWIESGLDGFIINRRRIPAHFTRVDQLEEIFQEKGKSHPGFDCFVFRRALFPQMRLAEICIGVPFIGITFAQNLFALCDRFKLFEHEFLTFHIGMEIFKGRASRDYFRYNRKQFWKAMHSDLKKHQSSKKLPYSQLPFPIRWVRWGLQPSIPIRFALLLEWRRLKKFLGFGK